MKLFPVLFTCLALAPGLLPAAGIEEDDIYGEDATRNHSFRPAPGSEWKEEALALPPYPREADLIEVEVDRPDFPYKVFIDGASLSFGKDRVIRYTVVLRSSAGVDNVSFEGIQCARRQYKRYAYGVNGRFHPLPAADWEYIRPTRQVFYRAVFAEQYFCPPPMGDVVGEIRYKLEGAGGDDRYLYMGDEE